jgi:hypothetical protein
MQTDLLHLCIRHQFVLGVHWARKQSLSRITRDHDKDGSASQQRAAVHLHYGKGVIINFRLQVYFVTGLHIDLRSNELEVEPKIECRPQTQKTAIIRANH